MVIILSSFCMTLFFKIEADHLLSMELIDDLYVRKMILSLCLVKYLLVNFIISKLSDVRFCMNLGLIRIASIS